MRAHDWSSTPLGAPETWPQSLRTILRVMLDSRFAMWMAWGPEGTFFCNDAYLPTTGTKRDRVLGTPAKVVWAEIWREIGPLIQRVLATGVASWDEGLLLFLNRSGYSEETFHTFSYSPLYDDANRIAGMLCVVTETTEQVIGQRRLELLRKLATQSIAQAQSLAAAARELMQPLAAGVLDVPIAAVYLADWQHGTATLVASPQPDVLANAPAVVRLANTPSSWLICEAITTGEPQVIGDFGGTCARIAGAWQEPVHQAMVLPLMGSGQEHAVGALLLGVSTRRALDDGYRSFFSLVAAQVASGLADAQARLTERQRAEALAELDRAKNNFFSNVSHEFRTPLTLMLGPIEELLQKPDLEGRDRESLEQLRRNGLRMRKLVNSLLDFSRIEAGRVQANYQATDLALLTEDLASTFRSAIEAAGLEFEVSCPPLAEPVYVDREMWEKVVLNLLSNAFKFTFEGRIAVRLTGAAAAVQLEIEDTGIGLDPNDAAHLFDRFHRVQGARSRSQEGSGIGLALVRELVRLHGGWIEVDSELGRGSTFKVSIPLGLAHLPAERVGRVGEEIATSVDRISFVDDGLRANDAAHGGEHLPAALPDPGGRSAGDAQILVVDDNADMRRYLERVLAPHWRVTTAGNGVHALELLNRRVADLIVTDIMMPQMDGFELVAQLRADPRFQEIPVLVLSAQAGEEARLEGLQRGADDYLVKPFSSRELVARIDVQLMRVRMRHIKEALNQRLAEVFQEAPVGVALLSGPEHVHEFVNVEYSARHQQRRLLGVPFREAFPELEGQGLADRLDAVRQSGQSYVVRSLQVRLNNPLDGQAQRSYWDLAYQPLFDERGAADGIAVIVSDVTDLALAREQAEASNRAKDEFIAMLGHELRNPLSPIVTALELMRMKASDAFARERSILERQVQHMVRLVGDLLDVARIARGSIELEKVVLETEAVIAKALETARPLIEARRQVLEVDIPARGLKIWVDPTRASQILANLLTNAAKFSAEGSTIRIVAERDSAEVIVSVIDQGKGMPAHELNAVFELFFQGNSQAGLHRPHGGLGLGLTIAKSLATAHGGSLSASSPGPGLGSTFTLRLPLFTGIAAIARPTEEAGTEHLEGHGQRVLVVDDNVDAAQTLDRLLQAWGFETLVVFDGVAALSLLEHEPVAAVLLDIGLPGLDGFEVARRVRSDRRYRQSKLIALTGYGQEADVRKSIEAGFDAHLIKPVDSTRLAAALRSLGLGPS